MDGRCSIYGVCDPRSEELRYIGRTRLSLKSRLSAHYATKGNTHRLNWFQSLRKAGVKPEIFEIENVPLGEHSEAERFWILYFRSIGANLVNGSLGGEGSVLGNVTTFRPGFKMPDSVKEKIRKTLTGTTRPSPSDEARAKMAAAKLGKKRGPWSDEAKEKIASAQRGIPKPPLTDEVKQRLSQMRRGKPWTAARRLAEQKRLEAL